MAVRAPVTYAPLVRLAGDRSWRIDVATVAATLMLAATAAVSVLAFAPGSRLPVLQYIAWAAATAVAGLGLLRWVNDFWRFVLLVIAARISLDGFNDQFG